MEVEKPHTLCLGKWRYQSQSVVLSESILVIARGAGVINFCLKARVLKV